MGSTTIGGGEDLGWPVRGGGAFRRARPPGGPEQAPGAYGERAIPAAPAPHHPQGGGRALGADVRDTAERTAHGPGVCRGDHGVLDTRLNPRRRALPLRSALRREAGEEGWGAAPQDVGWRVPVYHPGMVWRLLSRLPWVPAGCPGPSVGAESGPPWSSERALCALQPWPPTAGAGKGAG